MIYNPDEIEDPSWLLGLLGRKEKEKINMPNHARKRCRFAVGRQKFLFSFGRRIKKGRPLDNSGMGSMGGGRDKDLFVFIVSVERWL